MKKKNTNGNYLDKIPVINEKYSWQEEEDGKISILIHNKGFFNRIAQKFFKKPEISYVHLDENGSFIWKYIDGKNTIGSIAEYIREEFGDKAEPLYERLIKFIQILQSYGFVYIKE